MRGDNEDDEIDSENDLSLKVTDQERVDEWCWKIKLTVKPYFHYGCALRCVAREIETLLASLNLSPRNATQRNAQR